MKSEEIKILFSQFEAAASELEGIECWSARELQILLGYSKWENFEKVIRKAKDACSNAGEETDYHFPDVRKTIPMPKGATKGIDDILLTRYACYLIAQNGELLLLTEVPYFGASGKSRQSGKSGFRQF